MQQNHLCCIFNVQRPQSMVCFLKHAEIAVCVLPRWHQNRSTPWQVPAEAPVLAVRGWFRTSSK